MRVRFQSLWFLLRSGFSREHLCVQVFPPVEPSWSHLCLICFIFRRVFLLWCTMDIGLGFSPGAGLER